MPSLSLCSRLAPERGGLIVGRMATMQYRLPANLDIFGNLQKVQAQQTAQRVRANDEAVFRGRMQAEQAAFDGKRRMAESMELARAHGDALARKGAAMTDGMHQRQRLRFDEMVGEMPARKSMLFTHPGQMSEADNQLRNHYLDMGLNPDNPSEVLTSSMGFGDVGAARRNFAMINAPFFKPGERRLSHSEGSAAVLGAVKNGSEFLDPNDPKWHTVTKKFWADSVAPLRTRNGRPEFVVPTAESFRDLNGYDPFDTPERQAQGMRENIGRERARYNFESGIYRENLRRMGANMRNERRISSGGTIKTGGREYQTPMGGGPMFDATPAVEEAMTPEQFVTPAPVRRSNSAELLDMETGNFFPSRSSAEVVGETGGMALPPQAAAAQSLQAGVSRFGRQVKDWLMDTKRPLWNHGGARNRRPAPSFGG